MKILIDIGSSTVKVYSFSKQAGIQTLETKSIHFREGFSPEQGITPENQQALIKYVQDITARYGTDIHVYATAIFRKFAPSARKLFAQTFRAKTGIPFTIVPHELEGKYLEFALAGKYHGSRPALLINIGGGSTELIVTQAGKTIRNFNLEIGVMTIMQAFPELNKQVSPYNLDEVTAFIKDLLPTDSTQTSVAVYNGGELTYMQIAGYPLEPNTVFQDSEHPVMISYTNFTKHNQEIFSKVRLSGLEELMPNDPLWMHGARPCSAIAQAICEHFGVQTIVPSDSNMIHGIIRHDFTHGKTLPTR